MTASKQAQMQDYLENVVKVLLLLCFAYAMRTLGVLDATNRDLNKDLVASSWNKLLTCFCKSSMNDVTKNLMEEFYDF